MTSLGGKAQTVQWLLHVSLGRFHSLNSWAEVQQQQKRHKYHIHRDTEE